MPKTNIDSVIDNLSKMFDIVLDDLGPVAEKIVNDFSNLKGTENVKNNVDADFGFASEVLESSNKVKELFLQMKDELLVLVPTLGTTFVAHKANQIVDRIARRLLLKFCQSDRTIRFLNKVRLGNTRIGKSIIEKKIVGFIESKKYKVGKAIGTFLLSAGSRRLAPTSQTLQIANSAVGTIATEMFKVQIMEGAGTAITQMIKEFRDVLPTAEEIKELSSGNVIDAEVE